MCNIAGYSGSRQAAPILIEMLRRQEAFDGGVCCGIATIHEGRLYCRKVVGDVDTLIKTTDALYLPGNVGIAHTRPGGDARTYNFAHPFIAEGGRFAGITNGTERAPGYFEAVQRATDFLQENGYEFFGGTALDKCSFPRLKNGNYVSCVEMRVNLVSYYVGRGYDIHTAMARVASECYTDSVLGILSLDTPDAFHILRTTRPAFAVSDNDGTYVASCQFAFPDELGDKAEPLPVMRPAKISRDGVSVSAIRMQDCEEVGEISDGALSECYERLSAMLSGKASSPLTFDDLELEVYNNMKDLIPGQNAIMQDAMLVYRVLYRLHREGKLQMCEKMLGKKKRYYMWIDN
jgi:glucosamine 6-phosphate synthetase-like amidotransferase/phosphosugar isomerase protein